MLLKSLLTTLKGTATVLSLLLLLAASFAAAGWTLFYLFTVHAQLAVMIAVPVVFSLLGAEYFHLEEGE